MISMITWAAVTFAVLAQIAIRFGVGVRLPIGDEQTYLAQAKPNPPPSNLPFIRVPLMQLMTSLLYRLGGESRVRDGVNVLALGAVLLTGLAAGILLGPVAAAATIILLTVLPDRVLLSGHIWPDSLLAVWHTLLLVLGACSIAGELVPYWAYGLVLALAVLTRIDALMLAPAVMAMFVLLNNDVLNALPWLVLPTVLALSILTVLNGLRLGIWWPDTTTQFNIAIMLRELDHAETPLTSVTLAVLAEPTNGGSGTIRSILRRLGSVAGGVVRRTAQMLGPDTFVQQRLLRHPGGAYPTLSPYIRQVLGGAVGHSFGVLASLAIAACWIKPELIALLCPTSAAFLASCAVHSRTRFRYALLPGLTFAAVAGIIGADRDGQLWAYASSALIVGALLWFAPARVEVGSGNGQT